MTVKLESLPLSALTRGLLGRIAVDIVLLIAGCFGSTYIMARVNQGVQRAQYADLKQSVAQLTNNQEQEFLYLNTRIDALRLQRLPDPPPPP